MGKSAVLGWGVSGTSPRLRVPGSRTPLPLVFHIFLRLCLPCPLRGSAPCGRRAVAWAVAPLGALALVGLLPRVAPRRHGARPCGALASLGTAVPTALFLGYRLVLRPPLGAVSPAQQPAQVCQSPAMADAMRQVPFLTRTGCVRWGAERPAPLTPSGGGTAAAIFSGGSLPPPVCPLLVFFMVLAGSRPLNKPK